MGGNSRNPVGIDPWGREARGRYEPGLDRASVTATICDVVRADFGRRGGPSLALRVRIQDGRALGTGGQAASGTRRWALADKPPVAPGVSRGASARAEARGSY